MTETIDRFDGEYRFLSNFWMPSISEHADVHWLECGGHTWKSAEHAYQAMKFDQHGIAMAIANASSPGLAKRLANAYSMHIRPEWYNNSYKFKIMKLILKSKFDCKIKLLDNKTLREKLEDTYPAVLVEGNTWGDRFWGVYRGKGENHLGKLLMELRLSYMSTTD